MNEEEETSDCFFSSRKMVFAVPAAFYAYIRNDTSSPATMGVKCKIYISINEKATTTFFFVHFLELCFLQTVFMHNQPFLEWMPCSYRLSFQESFSFLYIYILLVVSSLKIVEHMETKRMHTAQTTKHKQLIRR